MVLISVKLTRAGNIIFSKNLYEKYLLRCFEFKIMGKIEEKLADKAEPVLGFRPSSKVKKGRIGLIISIICIVIVIIELIRSSVI